MQLPVEMDTLSHLSRSGASALYDITRGETSNLSGVHELDRLNDEKHRMNESVASIFRSDLDAFMNHLLSKKAFFPFHLHPSFRFLSSPEVMRELLPPLFH